MYEIFLRLLEATGQKTADVVKATGISYSSFTDWKKGRCNPRADKVKKIADHFGVSYAYMMGWEEDAIQSASDRAIEHTFVEAWKERIGVVEFSADEWDEIENYLKFIISKRNV